MASNNFMQRVGKSSCVRCEFETDESMSFAAQDAAMMAHLAEKHPGWMTDGGASILKNRMPKSDKDRIIELEAQLADEELAFNHANEIVGKLEASLAEAKSE